MIGKFLKNRQYPLAAAFLFLVFLAVGVSIYPDYGISSDEIGQRNFGLHSWEYMMSGDFSSPPSRHDWDHGPALQIFLVAVEKLMHLEDSREIFLMRHLVNFLVFFAAVWFFYLLCKYHFGDRKMAILGALFLIVSPRIFAHSFYNPKDLPFLSFFVISMYTLVRLSEKLDCRSAVTHAIVCAFLIDIRITGVVMVAITFFSLGGEWIGVRREHGASARATKVMLVYLAVLIPSIIAFWPYLWHNPLGNFIHAFRSMSHYRWRGRVLYFGSHIKGSELPWHYIPVWLIITTPLLYVAAFFAGLSIFVAGFLKNPSGYLFGDQTHRREVVFCLCFFLPLAAVIALKSVLYNGWRHMFFIYPAFLLISLNGIRGVFRFIKTRPRPRSQRYKSVMVSIIVFSIFFVSYSMIRSHPYQNVYFNELVPKGEFLQSLFELDYWGLSYREGLEYILSHDDEDAIRVGGATSSVGKNRLILQKADRERLRVTEPEDATYYLSHRFDGKKAFPGGEEYYSIKAYGTKIMIVCKLREESALRDVP
jgi:Dolichyl-phosphate-mannose-protein mannosyltransferase